MTRFEPLENDGIEMILAMMRDFYAIDGYPIDVENSRKLFTEFISGENLGKAWLVYHGSEIAGYLVLTFVFSFEYGGKIAFIDELYIKEASRGKGIGSAAVTFAKAQAQKLSLGLLYLEVEPHNAAAQKLYLGAGFEAHSRKLMKYKIQ